MKKRVSVVLAVMLAVALMLLCMIEKGTAAGADFLNLLYEAVSASGTVGLSTGLTGQLHPLSKCVIMLLMFIGRVGPVTMGVAFAHRYTHTEELIRYPEDRIMVG